MTYDGTMVMPSSFIIIDNDEMEYIDAGWSASTLGSNVKGLLSRGGSRVLSVISWSQVSAMATYAYATLCAKFGYQVVKVVTLVGGIIAGIIAALAVTAAVLYLGNNRVFY
jgi:hypothetical protein